MLGASKASCRDHQCMGIGAALGLTGDLFQNQCLCSGPEEHALGPKDLSSWANTGYPPRSIGNTFKTTQRHCAFTLMWCEAIGRWFEPVATGDCGAEKMQREQDARAQLNEYAHTGMHARVACACADFCWDQQASSSFPAFHRRPWGEVGSFVGLRRWACRPCIVAIPHDQYPLARPRSLLPVCLAVDSTRTSGWQRP